TSRRRPVRPRLPAMRSATTRPCSKEASASPCWRFISDSSRDKPDAAESPFIGSTFHPAGGEAGDQRFLQHEGDRQRRQSGQDSRGRDKPVICGPPGGEIGNRYGQGLGSEIVRIEQRIKELIPGQQNREQCRRAEARLGNRQGYVAEQSEESYPIDPRCLFDL